MSTPQAKKSTDGDSSTKTKRVSKAWGLLGIAIAILGTGIGGYIQHLLQPYFTVLQIVWATLPLTIAVTIYAFLVLRGVRVSLLTFSLIVVGTFIASVITGVTGGTRVYNYLFHPNYNCFSVNSSQYCYESGYSAPSGNPVWAILSGYLHIYGIVGAIRSLLVGGFLGYSLAVMAEPSPRPGGTQGAGPQSA
ncbi:MAG: hypothetical protein ABSA02_13930 [Trebonia sp.]|jgi:hypothetical protein